MATLSDILKSEQERPKQEELVKKVCGSQSDPWNISKEANDTACAHPLYLCICIL